MSPTLGDRTLTASRPPAAVPIRRAAAQPGKTSTWRHTLVVAAAVIVALAIWALARLLGVELTVGKGQHASQVGGVDVLVAALLAGLAAWTWPLASC